MEGPGLLWMHKQCVHNPLRAGFPIPHCAGLSDTCWNLWLMQKILIAFQTHPVGRKKKHKWREIWPYLTGSKLWLIYVLWCNMTLPWAATEGNLPCDQRVVKNVSISVNPSGETFGSRSTGWDDSTPSWVGHPAPVHTVCDTRIDSSWLADWEFFVACCKMSC